MFFVLISSTYCNAWLMAFVDILSSSLRAFTSSSSSSSSSSSEDSVRSRFMSTMSSVEVVSIGVSFLVENSSIFFSLLFFTC